MHVDSVIFGAVNTGRQYTQADGQQFEQAFKLLGDSRFDFVGPGAQRNYELIGEFFEKNRQLPVTVETIFRAVEERKSDFVSLTPAQHTWYQAAQNNPELANQIANYLASTTGLPGALVKDGDGLFENLLLLFNELSSRRETVSAQTIAGAKDRIARRPGKQL